MSDIPAHLLNRYAELIRQRWEDNAVEALIGKMSTIINAHQLEVLIEDLVNQLEQSDN